MLLTRPYYNTHVILNIQNYMGHLLPFIEWVLSRHNISAYKNK